jgi:hypothetical protein
MPRRSDAGGIHCGYPALNAKKRRCRPFRYPDGEAAARPFDRPQHEVTVAMTPVAATTRGKFVQAQAMPSVALPVSAARERRDDDVAAPVIGGVVGVAATTSALHRRLPTTAFSGRQRVLVPLAAGLLAFGAGTGVAAGAGSIRDRLGVSADAFDAVAGAAGIATAVVLSRGSAASRSNAAALGRTIGGLVGVAAVGDAAIRHGAGLVEDATGLDGDAARAAAFGVVAATGAAAALVATRRLTASNATYTGERAFGHALGERVATKAPITPLPTVSLGPDSLVPQESLGKLARGFLEGALPASTIKAATGRADAVDAVRVMVDFRSAPTSAARVQLMRDEVRRLGVIGGANHRDTIVAVSPAGAVTDLVATDARELLAGGNTAHVAVAFSNKPALASIGRVREGVRQFREVVEALRAEIDQLPPERRPRLEVYGESIGGIVGEQAVLKQGIAGLDALGVDRAVFVGAPSAGRAKRALLAAEAGVETPRVARYAGLDDLDARVAPEVQAGLRVHFLEHAEDAISNLRPRRIWQATPLPEGAVVHNQADHIPFVTFSHMLGDTVNFKMPPGQLGARGHNYGADMPGVLRRLHPETTADQMDGIVDTIRRQAATRDRFVEVPDLPPAFHDGRPPVTTGAPAR